MSSTDSNVITYVYIVTMYIPQLIRILHGWSIHIASMYTKY